MSTATIERLGETTEAAYRALVLRTAGGEELSEAEVREGLLLAGRDLAAFGRHVELIQQRREAAEQLAEAQRSDRLNEAAELLAEGHRLRDEVERRQKEYETKLHGLRQRQWKAEADGNAMSKELNKMQSRANALLLKTCDGSIESRIIAGAARVAELEHTQKTCRRDLADRGKRAAALAEAEERYVRLKATGRPKETFEAECKEKIDTRRRELSCIASEADINKQIADCRAKQQELQAEGDRLQASKLNPESVDWS